MTLALVFVSTEIGSESEVVRSLRKIEAVKEVHLVYGVYDMVAKVEAETMENLKEIITHEVRKRDKVRSTLTLIAIE